MSLKLFEEGSPAEIAEKLRGVTEKIHLRMEEVKSNCNDPHVAPYLNEIITCLAFCNGYFKGIANGKLKKGEPQIAEQLATIKRAMSNIENIDLQYQQGNSVQNQAATALEEMTLSFKELGLDTTSPDTPVTINSLINEMISTAAENGMDSDKHFFNTTYQQEKIGFRR